MPPVLHDWRGAPQADSLWYAFGCGSGFGTLTFLCLQGGLAAAYALRQLLAALYFNAGEPRTNYFNAGELRVNNYFNAGELRITHYLSHPADRDRAFAPAGRPVPYSDLRIRNFSAGELRISATFGGLLQCWRATHQCHLRWTYFKLFVLLVLPQTICTTCATSTCFFVQASSALIQLLQCPWAYFNSLLQQRMQFAVTVTLRTIIEGTIVVM